MQIQIDKHWELRSEGLEVGPADWPRVAREESGWLPCSLPCDVHVPLIESGAIREPLDTLNSYDCEWIEGKSWWFRGRFESPEGFRELERCELRMEMLDVEADVFLNGAHLGRHRSAFYPFAAEVKRLLLPGTNVVGVRVTSGIERVSDQDLAGFKPNVSTEAKAGRGDRGEPRRALLRKPQYVFGWDWGPRVATAGIMGDVTLECSRALRWTGLHVSTKEATSSRAVLAVRAEIENTHLFSTREGEVVIELKRSGRLVASAREERLLRSGVNYFELVLAVEKPELWWPNGYGGQPLYDLGARAASDGEAVEFPIQRIGIRTVELDQSPELGGRRFALVVNGERTFCKGASWVPPDSIYARVTPEKYELLVEEAREANFNMLRIWGGGRYEAEPFYAACDRAGILIWQDFMFACSVYPDNREWFREEVRREAEYQTRRLRNHACIALFSGSNEDSWFFDEWWDGVAAPKPAFDGGAATYNLILPAAVQASCPEIPYWNGSPYGGEHPNGNDAGDRHHWLECTMSPIMANRIRPEAYDEVTARFVSEYGYIAPTVRSSIERYHAGAPVERDGAVWSHHNNTFEKGTVIEGIRRHYRDPEGMSLDEYLLYAALVQCLMYGYSLDALRVSERNSGALFWMYTDCWGETGWTIVDYYGARKPAFYAVKRAFAPRRLVLRAKDGEVVIHAANDTPERAALALEIGVVDLARECDPRETRTVEIPARFRGVLARVPKTKTDPSRELWYARAPGGSGYLPATLRETETRKLSLLEPDLAVSGIGAEGGRPSFTVRSRRFAHAVHFGFPADVRLSDEFFDLLPGEERTVAILSGKAPARAIEARSVLSPPPVAKR